MRSRKKVMYIILYFILFSFVSCASNRPIATVHHERIETQMQAVPIGSDTIEIEYRLRCDYRPLCPTDSNSVEIAHTRHSSSELGSALVYSQFSPNSGEELNRQNIQPVGRTDTACRVPTIESVRSTRALSITKTITDTTSTLRITLRPDTVFVPYTNHILSDTIIAPCPTTQAKLTTARWQIFALILILIAIIIYRLKPFFINP